MHLNRILRNAVNSNVSSSSSSSSLPNFTGPLLRLPWCRGILVVGRTNTARTQLAEAYLRRRLHVSVPLISAGSFATNRTPQVTGAFFNTNINNTNRLNGGTQSHKEEHERGQHPEQQPTFLFNPRTGIHQYAADIATTRGYPLAASQYAKSIAAVLPADPAAAAIDVLVTISDDNTPIYQAIQSQQQKMVPNTDDDQDDSRLLYSHHGGTGVPSHWTVLSNAETQVQRWEHRSVLDRRTERSKWTTNDHYVGESLFAHPTRWGDASVNLRLKEDKTSPMYFNASTNSREVRSGVIGGLPAAVGSLPPTLMAMVKERRSWAVPTLHTQLPLERSAQFRHRVLQAALSIENECDRLLRALENNSPQ